MQFEVIDKLGRARPFRRGDRLADGERLRVPLTFMDSAARATHDALAAKYRHAIIDSQPRGYVRGYAFAQDMARVAPENIRDAAQNAYEERRARLQGQWRKDSGEDVDQTPPTRLDAACSEAAQARASADGAYRDKCERLQNAWRHS